MRASLSRLLNHRLFEPIIMGLIIFNAILLALETFPGIMALAGPLILTLDKIILGIFVIEIILRMFHDFRGFWRDPWRICDFLVFAIAIIPTSGALSALRAFRILRVLRLVSAVPQMRRVVAGLLTALPGMGSIVALLGLIFFVFSVISTKLLGEAFPEWFGSLGASAYTLFQVMTLESWSMGIVRPVMEVFPMAWLLFVPFIILTAFAVLNLFIGVIVDAMQSENAENAHDEREAMKNESAAILQEVRALRAELAAMKAER